MSIIEALKRPVDWVRINRERLKQRGRLEDDLVNVYGEGGPLEMVRRCAYIIRDNEYPLVDRGWVAAAAMDEIRALRGKGNTLEGIVWSLTMEYPGIEGVVGVLSHRVESDLVTKYMPYNGRYSADTLVMRDIAPVINSLR